MDSGTEDYDRGVALFAPDGRLYQVEHAREAVKRGAPSLGIRATDGVVLAARTTRDQSSLVISESIDKLHKVENHVGATTIGHITDGRRLVEEMRDIAQDEQLQYGEPAEIPELTRKIADHVQESTKVGLERPYGAAIVVGGVDRTGPHVYQVMPDGTPSEWRAVAVGNQKDEFIEFFETHYTPDLTVDDAIDLSLDAFSSVLDESVSADDLSIATVTSADTNFERLDDAELANRCAALDNTGENQ